MRISCLHSTPSNIAVFEAARPDGMRLTHHVRADLLVRANHGLDAAIIAETQAQLRRLEPGSDAVLLTCSTLRPAAQPSVNVADALLALEVGERIAGKTVDIFFTNPGTRAASRTLFGSLTGAKTMTFHLIPGAWDRFLAGDLAAYTDAIAGAVAMSGAELVVLAQASMAPAVPASGRILSSPTVALRRIAAALETNSQHQS